MNSFKQRVISFWNWFKENKQALEGFLDRNKWQEAADFIQPSLKEVFWEVTFELRKQKEYELILSPSGDMDRKLLIRYFYEYRPESENWNFYSELPPKTGTLTYLGEYLKPEDFLIYPEISEEKHRISLAVYAPVIGNKKEKDQFTIVYILLNNLLGEKMFEHYVGEVRMIHGKNRAFFKKNHSLKLSTLHPWMEAEIGARKWPKASDINDIIEEYDGNPKLGKGPRYDITSGKTCQFKLCNEYYNKSSSSQSYMKSIGASYYFISTDPRKGEADEVREYLLDLFRKNRYGILIGEARGLEHAYLDMLLYSPEEFIKDYTLSHKNTKLYEFHE